MPADFPTQRPDGTTSVDARLDVSQEGARDLLDEYVSRWPATFGIDPLEALTSYPVVEEVSEALVEVVFEGRADNRLWKDAMVAFMHNLPDDAGEFAGFSTIAWVGGSIQALSAKSSMGSPAPAFTNDP